MVGWCTLDNLDSESRLRGLGLRMRRLGISTCPDEAKYVSNGDCVASCDKGHGISESEGALLCVACSNGKYAEHVNHTCVATCPGNTVTNQLDQNCDDDNSNNNLSVGLTATDLEEDLEE